MPVAWSVSMEVLGMSAVPRVVLPSTKPGSGAPSREDGDLDRAGRVRRDVDRVAAAAELEIDRRPVELERGDRQAVEPGRHARPAERDPPLRRVDLESEDARE